MYSVSGEMLAAYKTKPAKLRLAWLYAGNILRKACPEKIKLLHDKFRKRNLYALAKEIMSMPCNKNHADKTFVYESQAAYNAYFRELKK